MKTIVDFRSKWEELRALNQLNPRPPLKTHAALLVNPVQYITCKNVYITPPKNTRGIQQILKPNPDK